MPASRFERDANPPPGDRRPDQRSDAAARLEMRASPSGERPEQRPEETIEEPGYGHGV